MKKLAIPFVVGITIGLGATTGAALLLGGEPESLEESLAEAMEHGDSAQAGEHADSASHTAEATADTTHIAAEDAHGAEGEDSTSPSPAAIPGASAYTSAPMLSSQPVRGMSTAELAKLFATMQAREAARVLEHMEDQEVQMILGELGNREAASILSNLTPERAAVISRTILRGERSAQ